MRKIAVMEDFLTKAHMEKLRAAAERLGFAVDFYPKNVLPDEKAGEYEVIYGNCDPGLLKKATGLKWICCSFAGVDPFLSDDVYPNPDVLLSNSSGAYGTTIAEHIMMVTLMLLRRMPVRALPAAPRRWARSASSACAAATNPATSAMTRCIRSPSSTACCRRRRFS